MSNGDEVIKSFEEDIIQSFKDAVEAQAKWAAEHPRPKVSAQKRLANALKQRNAINDRIDELLGEIEDEESNER